MPKTFARVFSECQSLTRLERLTFLPDHRQMPEDSAECDRTSALFLYLADLLRFERVGDTSAILCVIRHFYDQLGMIALDLAVECDQDIPIERKHVWRIGIFDGRYVTMTGHDRALDLETGSSVLLPVGEMKTVTYNLTTLMRTRWFTTKSQRLHNPEKFTDGTPV